MENKPYGVCKKCGEMAVHLATGALFEVAGDQNDDCDNDSIHADEIQYVEICIGTHVCFKCGELEDIWIEEPTGKDLTEVINQDLLITCRNLLARLNKINPDNSLRSYAQSVIEKAENNTAV